MENNQFQKITAVKSSDLSSQTYQTAHLSRFTGVNTSNLWMGRVIGEPGKDSGAHHHGEAHTGGFILSGHTRILYGVNYEEYVDLGPGDFIYIPPFMPHIERNLSKTEPVVFITARSSGNIVVNIDKNEPSENVQINGEIKVVRANELDSSTNQTENLPRMTGVNAPNLWMGRVIGEPGKDSGAHHHGEAQTGGYILSGHTRIYFGKNYEEYVELGPGDFVNVPPYVPHIERNLSNTEPVVFITARNPSNIVVNLKDKLDF